MKTLKDKAKDIIKGGAFPLNQAADKIGAGIVLASEAAEKGVENIIKNTINDLINFAISEPGEFSGAALTSALLIFATARAASSSINLPTDISGPATMGGSNAAALALSTDTIIISVETVAATTAGVATAMAGGSGGGKEETSSLYEDSTIKKRHQSVANRTINTSPEEFIDNLIKSGYKKSYSKDGSVTILQKGDYKYIIRNAAKSHNGVTADLQLGKDIIVKLRFE